MTHITLLDLGRPHVPNTWEYQLYFYLQVFDPQSITGLWGLILGEGPTLVVFSFTSFDDTSRSPAKTSWQLFPCYETLQHAKWLTALCPCCVGALMLSPNQLNWSFNESDNPTLRLWWKERLSVHLHHCMHGTPQIGFIGGPIGLLPNERSRGGQCYFVYGNN